MFRKSGSSKTPRAGHTDWYSEPVEAPRADLAAINRNSSRQALRKMLIWVCVCSAPLGLFVGAGATIKASDAIAAAEDATHARAETGSQDDPGKFTATQHMSSWLAAVPSPLPGGRVISWDGSVRLADAPAPADSTGKQTGQPSPRYSERFTLTDGAGRGYTAEVLVAVDPRGGAKVISGPSLASTPKAATDDWADDNPWPGLEARTEVSEPVSTAVLTWAKAYTSGDADELRVAVGDTDGRHTYMPLDGVDDVTTEVTQVARIPKEDDEPARTIVQVQMSTHWAGRTGDTTNVQPIVMDLLIDRPDTAAPQVVAWGGPGTGPDLRRHQNALTIPVEAIPDSAQSDTPTGSGTPSAGDTGGATAPSSARTTTGASSSPSRSTSSRPAPTPSSTR